MPRPDASWSLEDCVAYTMVRGTAATATRAAMDAIRRRWGALMASSWVGLPLSTTDNVGPIPNAIDAGSEGEKGERSRERELLSALNAHGTGPLGALDPDDEASLVHEDVAEVEGNRERTRSLRDGPIRDRTRGLSIGHEHRDRQTARRGRSRRPGEGPVKTRVP